MPTALETDRNQVWIGDNINLDCTGLQFTDELVNALHILDGAYHWANSEHSYDISTSEEPGVIFEATPNGPFDTLYFYDGSWHETLPRDEEGEGDEHAEDCGCEFCN